MTQPPGIEWKTLVRKRASIFEATMAQEVVMIDSATGRYLSLDDIGSDIWRRLDVPCTFANLVEALADDYEADRTVIAEDLRVFLAKMIANDLIELDPSVPAA